MIAKTFDVDSEASVRILSRIGFEAEGCWPWLHSVDKDGYGGICIKSRQWRANRAVWTLFFGPAPDNLCVCHTCDNPLCVNPGHMFLGTNIQNIEDMDKKGRRNKYGKAKLSPCQIKAIREDKRLKKVVASEYKIGISTVGDIQKRRSWRNI